MSLAWNFFTLSDRVAYCNYCDYKKEFPPSSPTTTLLSHLTYKHPDLHEAFKREPKPRRNSSRKGIPTPSAALSGCSQSFSNALENENGGTTFVPLSSDEAPQQWQQHNMAPKRTKMEITTTKAATTAAPAAVVPSLQAKMDEQFGELWAEIGRMKEQQSTMMSTIMQLQMLLLQKKNEKRQEFNDFAS
ncbi:hypothetical protein niasHS_006369 [Heterodera schachtii]|uniref:BED-type domain-containing protein n=1 Tax=Heterodera schachtii TaxID=97005 RepID=A0ABD2JX87_HETSC